MGGTVPERIDSTPQGDTDRRQRVDIRRVETVRYVGEPHSVSAPQVESPHQEGSHLRPGDRLVRAVPGRVGRAPQGDAQVSDPLRVRGPPPVSPYVTERDTFNRTGLPRESGVPPHLTGASTWIRNNSTPREARIRKRRTRALRAIAESDPDFDRLFGLREDTESTNSHFKSILPNGRARTVWKHRRKLNLIAFQLLPSTPP